ncbi:CgeB family protein [Aquihabitans sp. McL0605]|uniref:CgeB family protein n=1 Tax=Aquihabitans sp. McL0605 TaxID=3415671 RepID=UPI003CE697BD
MGAPIRVLFVAMRWDYGDRSRGPSFEHQNFFDVLDQMDGIEVRELDFLSAFQEGGTDQVALELRAAVDDFRPDLAFFVLFEEQIGAEVLAELRDRPGLITYNWFCDDHWRFDDFTSRYAPLFNAVSTTDRKALPKYRALGIDAIKTQWAANPHLYAPTGNPVRLGTTFVGQSYGDRPWLIRRLQRAGVDVSTWGPGWPAGRLEFDDMVATFSDSRISLNLTAASNDPSVPRVVRGVLNRTYPPALRWVGRNLDQIKGRTFEIPACGGFQLSSQVDDIESYFEVGEEIAVFTSPGDLVEQARRYLGDDAARSRIAAAGLRRVQAEHTYEHRFRAILDHLGLSPAP